MSGGPPDPILDNPMVEEARGTYIGPCTNAEAVAQIRGHSTGPVFALYPEHGFAGGEVRQFSGWANEVGQVEGEEPPEWGVFVLTPEDVQPVPLATGIIYPDSLVLDLTPSSERRWKAEQWTGGLDLIFTEGVVVRLVFWHSISHVTETGDVARGFGSFRAKVEEEDS